MINTLICRNANQLEYRYKYTDRKAIAPTIDEKGSELVWCRNGLLLECTFANLVLLSNGIWVTPSNPLFMGTQISQLIEKGKVIADEISIEELESYSELRLVNAMLPLDQAIVLPVSAMRNPGG